MLCPLHNKAEDCKQRELFKHWLAMRARVEEAEAKPYPDKRVNEIIEPGKKAHHAQPVKEIVPRKYTDGPSEEEYPIRSYEIKLYCSARVPDHNKECGVDPNHKNVIPEGVACS